MTTRENSERELEARILAAATGRWQKVAMIISKVLNHAGDSTAPELVGTQIEVLVQNGKLEGQGDLSAWRHSEVRLPPPVP